jgi:hypothetical protein
MTMLDLMTVPEGVAMIARVRRLAIGAVVVVVRSRKSASVASLPEVVTALFATVDVVRRLTCPMNVNGARVRGCLLLTGAPVAMTLDAVVGAVEPIEPSAHLALAVRAVRAGVQLVRRPVAGPQSGLLTGAEGVAGHRSAGNVVVMRCHVSSLVR